MSCPVRNERRGLLIWRSSWILTIATLASSVALANPNTPLPGALPAAARAAGIEVGAAIDANLSTQRLEVAAREFTSATLENSLKWQPLAPSASTYDFAVADSIVDWAEQNDLRVRGHTLFWTRLNGLPGWLAGEVNAAADPAARLTELMESHAEVVVGRYAGRIPQWDVVNEPLATFTCDQSGCATSLDPANLFFQVLGESYLDVAFHAAHEADPNAALFLNETLAESLPAKFNLLVQVVQRMLDRNVPIHGIGLQGHFFLAPPNAASLQAQMETIQAMGLLVELTEVDIPISHFASTPDPLAAQAQAYADIFLACTAVPACTGITTWGIDDGDTWLDSFWFTQPGPNRPLLFDESLEPKPAYDEVVMTLPEPSSRLLLATLLLSLLGVRRSAQRPGTVS